RQSRWNDSFDAPSPQGVPPVSGVVEVSQLPASYVYDVEAVDVDHDSLTYSLAQAPTGMTIDPATGIITWADPQQKLLANPGFEDVQSPPVHAQGVLPDDWVPVATVFPAADTWSTDGSFGISNSQGYDGHFPEGAGAHGGVRWVAGADFGPGSYEGIG